MGEKVRLIVNRILLGLAEAGHYSATRAGRYVLAAVCALLALSQAGTIAQTAQPPQLATDITAARQRANVSSSAGEDACAPPPPPKKAEGENGAAAR